MRRRVRTHTRYVSHGSAGLTWLPFRGLLASAWRLPRPKSAAAIGEPKEAYYRNSAMSGAGGGGNGRIGAGKRPYISLLRCQPLAVNQAAVTTTRQRAFRPQ